MIEDPFYDRMLDVLKAEEARRLAEKRTFKYRLKRKVGIIKEDILPEGFVRADLKGGVCSE